MAAHNDNNCLFHLLNLKHKLLVKEQKCDNCLVETSEWVVIGKCQDKFCLKCISASTHPKNTCPTCKIKFNPDEDASTSNEMRKVYSEMESLLWNVMDLDRDEKYESSREESSSNKSLENPASSTSGDVVQLGKNIYLSHSGIDCEDIEIANKFVIFFNIKADSLWNDSVTHLVVKTVNGRVSIRTLKYFNALLSNCCIVSMDWMIDCMSSKSLLPEIDYIPFDSSKQPAPLTSWKVGQGLIQSPMEWTKECILYFHSSVKSNNMYSDIIVLVKKANITLAKHINELDKKFKMRVILFEPPLDNSMKEDIKSLKVDNDVLFLKLHWLIECLGQYRLIPVDSFK